MPRWHSDDGQAAVEFVALLPLLALLAALLWQAAVAGQAIWLASAAARGAARAEAVGTDTRAAALRALPPGLEAGAQVKRRSEGTVEVEVPVRAIIGGGA